MGGHRRSDPPAQTVTGIRRIKVKQHTNTTFKMDDYPTKLNVPAALLEKLHCGICTKYLSVLPIYSSTSLGPVCGRCYTEDLEDTVRNSLYENFLEVFRFPCSYITYGCSEYFFPSEINDHEQICRYRHVKCPSSSHTDCEWFGPCIQLQDHYEATHPIYLMKQLEFEINFISTFDENYILLYGDEMFIFKRKADANTGTLHCSVLYNGWNAKANDFSYQIKLANRSNNIKKVFDKFPTIDLDTNITEIVAEDVNRYFNNPSVIVGTIEITLNEVPVVASPKRERLKTCNEMLETIECPVCMEFMVPPIYQCLGGHSICSSCKETVTECPTCRGTIKDTRNYNLEKMINYLPYPCKNRESGCEVITDATSIRKHEKYCEFGLYDCPLKEYEGCNFKTNFSNIVTHLKSKHHDNIMELDTVHIPVDDYSYVDDYGLVLKYIDKLFILHFKMQGDVFFWCCQLIGSPENAKKYMCEIDIIDNVHGKNRIYLKGAVSALTSKENCFNEMPYFKLNFDQIEHFITDTLSFQVRVFKD